MKTTHEFKRFHSLLWGACLAISFSTLTFAGEPKPVGPYYGAFRELPITDITPEGWLAQFLQRQRDGLASHYTVSGHPFDSGLWTNSDPNFNWGNYAETAYLIDGDYRLGLLLKDKNLIDLGEKNIGYVLDHIQPNGQLGPPPEKLGPNGPKDIWCFSFIFFSRAMMEDYEVTGNPAILKALTGHYLSLPETFGSKGREQDSIENMCWLYGKTGDQRMLDIAKRTWTNFTQNPKSPWTLENMTGSKMMKGHGVSVCESSKQPAMIYLYTGDKTYLDATMGEFKGLERDHELVDGVISSDEALHGKKPEGVHETCDITDYSWSLGYALEASGDATFGDKIERAVFNAGFGAIDKEFKALQYFSSPNQMVSNQNCSAPKFGPANVDRQAYRPEFAVQCCTGNVHRMLPNFTSRLWLSDGKGGLVAALYSPNSVTAPVGVDGAKVTINEKTDYPFDGKIDLKVIADKPVSFPLYLRIPAWANGATVSINGQPLADKPVPGTFLKLERTFASGDTVSLDFPMAVRQETPVADGISLMRGPLVFSLKIQENRTKVTDARIKDPAFPAWDIAAGSPWNYALAIKGDADLAQVKVEAYPISDFPWTPATSPVTLTVPARQVSAWGLTPEGQNPPLPTPPLALATQTEQVQLIPDGATQLRVSVFPVAASK